MAAFVKARSPKKRPGQAGGVRAKNRLSNIDKLTRAGLRLFLSRGISSVTIDQIVTRAGMAKGSFYRYIGGKAALVELVLAPLWEGAVRAFDACEARLKEVRTEQLAGVYLQLAADVAALVDRHPRQVLLFLQEARAKSGAAGEPVRRLAVLIRERGVALGEVARAAGLVRDIDPRVSALTVIGAGEALLFEALSGRSRPDRGLVSAELVRIILGGIARD